jgi:hypothetical protein
MFYEDLSARRRCQQGAGSAQAARKQRASSVQAARKQRASKGRAEGFLRFPVDTTDTGPYIRQARRKVTGAQGQPDGSPRRKQTARIPTFKLENPPGSMPS